MNIGKSIRVALAMHEKDMNWLAQQMDCSGAHVRKLSNQESATGATIKKLAAVFGMPASQFIALGE